MDIKVRRKQPRLHPIAIDLLTRVIGPQMEERIEDCAVPRVKSGVAVLVPVLICKMETIKRARYGSITFMLRNYDYV